MESFWVTRLDPLMGPALIEAMGELCDGDKFPTLKAIVDLQRARAKRKASGALPQVVMLTPEERKRADHVAIQSMLWLHYNHPEKWPLSSYDGSIMARLFGGSPVEALTKAKGIYTREELDQIMAKRFEVIDREDSTRV